MRLVSRQKADHSGLLMTEEEYPATRTTKMIIAALMKMSPLNVWMVCWFVGLMPRAQAKPPRIDKLPAPSRRGGRSGRLHKAPTQKSGAASKPPEVAIGSTCTRTKKTSDHNLIQL